VRDTNSRKETRVNWEGNPIVEWGEMMSVAGSPSGVRCGVPAENDFSVIKSPQIASVDSSFDSKFFTDVLKSGVPVG